MQGNCEVVGPYRAPAQPATSELERSTGKQPTCSVEKLLGKPQVSHDPLEKYAGNLHPATNCWRGWKGRRHPHIHERAGAS